MDQSTTKSTRGKRSRSPEDKGRAQSGAALPAGWIALKMDERVFTVMRSTLVDGAPNSIFASIFKGEDDGGSGGPFTLAQDLSHPLKPYLFDRNPKYFEPVLDYLRTGELPEITVGLKGVLNEAEYFGVEPLIDAIKEKLAQEAKQQEALAKSSHRLSRVEVEKMLAALDVAQQTNSKESATLTPYFCGMNLEGLDFSGLYLMRADFRGANVRNADFSRCDLEKSVFYGADLTGARFDRGTTHVWLASFSGAKGIDADTIRWLREAVGPCGRV